MSRSVLDPTANSLQVVQVKNFGVPLVPRGLGSEIRPSSPFICWIGTFSHIYWGGHLAYPNRWVEPPLAIQNAERARGPLRRRHEIERLLGCVLPRSTTLEHFLHHVVHRIETGHEQ